MSSLDKLPIATLSAALLSRLDAVPEQRDAIDVALRSAHTDVKAKAHDALSPAERLKKLEQSIAKKQSAIENLKKQVVASADHLAAYGEAVAKAKVRLANDKESLEARVAELAVLEDDKKNHHSMQAGIPLLAAPTHQPEPAVVDMVSKALPAIGAGIPGGAAETSSLQVQQLCGAISASFHQFVAATKQPSDIPMPPATG